MLEAAGWHVQNHAEHNTGAAFGIAVREYPLKADQAIDFITKRLQPKENNHKNEDTFS